MDLAICCVGYRFCLKLKRVYLICKIFMGTGLKIKHNVESPVYNHTLTTILVEYASVNQGFEVIELIVDVQNCLQVQVFCICWGCGLADDLDAMLSHLEALKKPELDADLFWKQLDFDYRGCTDGKVHDGFFNAYNNTIMRSGILDAVSRAKKAYEDLKIMVTGHSMGGAMAACCRLDLALIYGSKNVQVTTFGMPRIDNVAFASYYSQVVPNTFRVTHGHDLVPHLPPYYHHFPQKTYHHFPAEVILLDFLDF
ncbi:putative feruloyl esterase [Helianthus annuus]|nr:putative feruloyl esterase [Helianthus annuus]KAJ0686620.1 putative feruloyl esterase [Helianthus annuus]KAJ0690433.1 putative feruloyl esterase [Helianthus annuus]KAJ0871975.1 putative feruloyl esterase [Helianthus annuus]